MPFALTLLMTEQSRMVQLTLNSTDHKDLNNATCARVSLKLNCTKNLESINIQTDPNVCGFKPKWRLL